MQFFRTLFSLSFTSGAASHDYYPKDLQKTTYLRLCLQPLTKTLS